MLCVVETNSGDISEVPGGGSHSQDLLGEAKGSSSSVGSSSEMNEMSLGWQVCIGCFALGKSLCLPNKGFMEIQHAGRWKFAWKNTKKKLRELTVTFLGFTNLLPPKGTDIKTGPPRGREGQQKTAKSTQSTGIKLTGLGQVGNLRKLRISCKL